MATDRYANSYKPIKLPNTGAPHPHLLYGTAFKEDATGRLTTLALLKHGFKGVDTANYPTAYNEPQTGEAIREALMSGKKRSELLIQTKFTPAWAHAEGKLPYNADQPVGSQVHESVEQSFAHLGVDYIDALLLHVPYESNDDNLAAWRALETYITSGRVGVLGVSNCPLETLQYLTENASSPETRPLVVQNRFQKEGWSKYDVELREYLSQQGGIYQGFWLLKTNKEILGSELLKRFCEEVGVTKEVGFYLLVLGLPGAAMSVVAGPASEDHMAMDVEKIDAALGNEEMVVKMKGYLGEFEELLREIASESEAEKTENA